MHLVQLFIRYIWTFEIGEILQLNGFWSVDFRNCLALKSPPFSLLPAWVSFLPLVVLTLGFRSRSLIVSIDFLEIFFLSWRLALSSPAVGLAPNWPSCPDCNFCWSFYSMLDAFGSPRTRESFTVGRLCTFISHMLTSSLGLRRSMDRFVTSFSSCPSAMLSNRLSCWPVAS